jgi:hypothetical protein
MFKYWRPNTPSDKPEETLARLRTRILGGARPPINSLSREEMAAAGQLINQGIAKIGSAACRPILLAKLG